MKVCNSSISKAYLSEKQINKSLELEVPLKSRSIANSTGSFIVRFQPINLLTLSFALISV